MRRLVSAVEAPSSVGLCEAPLSIWTHEPNQPGSTLSVPKPEFLPLARQMTAPTSVNQTLPHTLV